MRITNSVRFFTMLAALVLLSSFATVALAQEAKLQDEQRINLKPSATEMRHDRPEIARAQQWVQANIPENELMGITLSYVPGGGTPYLFGDLIGTNPAGAGYEIRLFGNTGFLVLNDGAQNFKELGFVVGVNSPNEVFGGTFTLNFGEGNGVAFLGEFTPDGLKLKYRHNWLAVQDYTGRTLTMGQDTIPYGTIVRLIMNNPWVTMGFSTSMNSFTMGKNEVTFVYGRRPPQ